MLFIMRKIAHTCYFVYTYFIFKCIKCFVTVSTVPYGKNGLLPCSSTRAVGYALQPCYIPREDRQFLSCFCSSQQECQVHFQFLFPVLPCQPSFESVAPHYNCWQFHYFISSFSHRSSNFSNYYVYFFRDVRP